MNLWKEREGGPGGETSKIHYRDYALRVLVVRGRLNGRKPGRKNDTWHD